MTAAPTTAPEAAFPARGREPAARLRRIRLFQTTAFRWTLGSAAIVAFGIAAMAGFFYWQTVGYITTRLDAGLLLEARSLRWRRGAS